MGDHTTSDHQGRRLIRRWPLIVAGLIVAGCVGFAVAWVIHPASPAAPPPASTSSTSVPVTSTIKVTCQDNGGDAARMQQAIDSSPAGSAIEFEGGTCLLSKGLTLPGGRTYTGGSTTGTVLKQDGPAGYVLASTSYVQSASTTGDPLAIRDLTIDCDGSGRTDGIILLNWQLDVEHVDVNRCGGSGIVDTNTGANGSAIKNTSVNSRFDNNFVSGSGQYGFEVIDSGNSVTDGFLDDNQIADSGADAVHIENAEGWDISGNHLYGVKQDALDLQRIYGTSISGNYIEDFGDGQGSGTWYGLAATAQDGPGSSIVGNKIFNVNGESGARYVYLAITGTNSGTGYASVTGNTIQGNRQSDVGLSFSGGDNSLRVTASGNNVTGVGTKVRTGANTKVTGGS